MSVKILLDPGHGVNTPGKRSPDGRFQEYAYNRLIVYGVVQHLIYRGYDAELLVPEPYDICLKERVRRINGICELYGKNNVLLVSVHVNTAGNESQWCSATGWSRYTSTSKQAAISRLMYNMLTPYDIFQIIRFASNIRQRVDLCNMRRTFGYNNPGKGSGPL